MEGVVAIIMVFSIPIVGALAFSPIGKALGERLRAREKGAIGGGAAS